ncbi:sensor histidine kinase [Hyphococcus luteus]|uniref:sensor histidine kinase n=1 Tax=Hyphococcus luteus TaxID=2058213 RepID=UPI0013FD82A0|nr:HAMP domain-containing sensor histidine kinase [Marinicaulis flavus]
MAVFASAVLYIIADRGATVLKENLAAATAGYARNAAFVFIGSLESNRRDFLEAARGSPSIETAFLATTDFEILAISTEDWRERIEEIPRSPQSSAAPFVEEYADYWIFFEPVFAVDDSACGVLGDGIDECAAPRELLGYLGVVGSKDLISSLFRQTALIVVVAAIVLLAHIYWATNWLSDRLYGPMLQLADRTRQTADRGYREKLEFSGPPEVENIAEAINHLIGRAAQTADQLQQMVADKTREEREAREEAEAARAFAERVKEWRTDLMAVNTHELLTPLRILIGELDRALAELRFLEPGRTRETLSKRLQQMRAPIRRIEEIVEQVNIAMRIEEGRIDVRPSEGKIEDVMERLQSLYSEEASRRGNKFNVRCEVEESIVTDFRMLETILSNLVSNACKFTSNGAIKLSAHSDGDMLDIICADTGIGIPEDKKALIFEPLYQADMSSRRVSDGLGLGLSIVKGYVDKLSGKIDVESRSGAGSKISIRLPIEFASVEEASESASGIDDIDRDAR